MDIKQFGKYLKLLREQKGLRIRDVEKLSDISNAYLSYLENGKRGMPSPEILQKLAPIYQVPYKDLLQKAGYLGEDDLPKQTYTGAELEELIPVEFRHLFNKDNLEYIKFAEELRKSEIDIETLRRTFKVIVEYEKQKGK